MPIYSIYADQKIIQLFFGVTSLEHFGTSYWSLPNVPTANFKHVKK